MQLQQRVFKIVRLIHNDDAVKTSALPTVGERYKPILRSQTSNGFQMLLHSPVLQVDAKDRSRLRVEERLVAATAVMLTRESGKAIGVRARTVQIPPEQAERFAVK